LIGEFDHSEEVYEEEETPKMPLYQKLSLGLLVLMVVFGVLYFVKPDIFESFRRSTSSSNEKMAVPIQRSNLKTQQDSLSFADSIMQSAEKAGLDVHPAKDTLKVSTSMSEVKPIITYDVIIASFATETKANEYVNRMKKKGFDAKISAMHGSRKNISIATYNNVDSAEKHLAKFRKQFKNSEIYIQKIKNN
ncbi:SPOR domain-containing protein, partial [Pedobacter sp.]